MNFAAALARAMWPARRGAGASRTLYLHIGCHKTGSTSLQAALASSGDLLARHGYSYYSCKNRHEIHPYMLRDRERGIVPDGMSFRRLPILAASLASRPGKVIASSENLSFVFRQGEIDSLRDCLYRVFTEVKIVCYIRRQDAQALSHHQEGAKPARKPEADLYGSDTTALPGWRPQLDLYLDYNQRLDMWARAFGSENMLIRVFDRDFLRGGDVISDFLDLLDIREQAPSFPKLNESIGTEQTKIGHLMNGIIGNNDLKRFILAYCGSDGRVVTSREEARQFYSRYREGNRALNQRYAVSPIDSIFPEQDLLEDSATENQQWNEESANAALAHVLEAIDALTGELDVDAIRDAAIKLERKDIKLSYTLMKLASVLRPSGHYISAKMTEYREKLGEPPAD